MRLMNIADLRDPNDKLGRSYREINNATAHKLAIGQLVEIESGVRLFIEELTRDCDGTPLYSLGDGAGRNYLLNGYTDDCLTVIDVAEDEDKA